MFGYVVHSKALMAYAILIRVRRRGCGGLEECAQDRCRRVDIFLRRNTDTADLQDSCDERLTERVHFVNEAMHSVRLRPMPSWRKSNIATARLMASVP